MPAEPDRPEPLSSSPTLGIPIRVQLDREHDTPDQTTPYGTTRLEDESESIHIDLGDRGDADVDSGPLDSERSVGRYLIEKELGRGGMGVVYRAFDRDLRRQVAMKVMGRRIEARDDLVARFVEEAQATAQLQHPGIVPVYEIGLDDEGRLFFTMKLVQGRTLDWVVADEEISRFRLLEIFVEVCRTVAYAHERGVVHRDLKPDNIMVGQFGEVSVMDWGLVKVLGEALDDAPGEQLLIGSQVESKRVDIEQSRPLTQVGVVMGTPSFMAPEQARGERDAIGPATDVFSLGAVLYFILTGEAPFVGKANEDVVASVLGADPIHPRHFDRSVARELEAICLKALSKEPSARYSSALALAEDVQAFLEDRPVRAWPEGIVGRSFKAARRHQALTTTIAVAVLIGLIGSIVAIVQLEQARREAEQEGRRAQAGWDQARANAAETEEALQLARQREQEARRNLFGLILQKAEQAFGERRMLEAERLFARALHLDDQLEVRQRLLASRLAGARREWAIDLAEGVFAPALSADGSRLTYAEGKVVKTVALSPGPTPETLAPLPGEPESLGFTDEGLVWAFIPGEEEAVIAFWQPTPESWREYSFPWQSGRAVAVDAASQQVAVATGERVVIHALESEAPVVTLTPEQGRVAALAFYPGGKRLAVASEDRTVRLWRLADQEVEAEFPVQSMGIMELWLSQGGSRLISLGLDGSLRMWDAVTSRELGWLQVDGLISTASLDAMDASLVWAKDGTLKLWDGRRGRAALSLPPQGIIAAAARTTGPGGHLTVAGFGASVARFELGRPEGYTLRDIDGQALGRSRDGRYLAVDRVDGRFRLLDLERRRVAFELDEPGWQTRALAFGPEAKQLALSRLRIGGTLFGPLAPSILGQLFGTLRLYDAESGAMVRQLEVGSQWATGELEYDPSGRWLLARSLQRELLLWDLRAPEEAARLIPIEARGAAFSPDGSQLAVAANDGTIKLWQLEDGAGVGSFEGHSLRADDVAWSEDGGALASVGPDGLRLWSRQDDGRLELEHFQAGPGLESVVLSSQQDRVVTASSGEIRIHRLSAPTRSYEAALDGGGAPELSFDEAGHLVVQLEEEQVQVLDLDAVEQLFEASPQELEQESERATGLGLSEELEPVVLPYEKLYEE